MISKNFNKGGSRCNVRKLMWPIYSHAHIFDHGDLKIYTFVEIETSVGKRSLIINLSMIVTTSNIPERIANFVSIFNPSNEYVD